MERIAQWPSRSKRMKAIVGMDYRFVPTPDINLLSKPSGQKWSVLANRLHASEINGLDVTDFRGRTCEVLTRFRRSGMFRVNAASATVIRFGVHEVGKFESDVGLRSGNDNGPSHLRKLQPAILMIAVTRGPSSPAKLAIMASMKSSSSMLSSIISSPATCMRM